MKGLSTVVLSSIISCLLLLQLTACSGDKTSERRLSDATGLIMTAPDSALRLLNAIDAGNLNREQRARHALLTVKATDKSYLPHTSDSLINIALDYYDDSESLLSAESQYYSGRVNTDLKNYPPALKGFHNALRILSHKSRSDSAVLSLTGAVVSQHGQLLNNLRLFTEAVPFFKEAIRIDSLLTDTLNMFYDMRDLAFNYTERNESDSADMILDRAMKVSSHLSPGITCSLHEIRALNSLRSGRYDRAAKELNHILLYNDSSDNSLAFVIISRIYANTGRPDSAAYYARILDSKPFSANSLSAAIILAKNSLRTGNRDTIAKYHEHFIRQTVRLIDEQADFFNLPGNMFYRQMITEIDNSRLRENNNRLTLWIICIALTTAVAISILFVILYRHARLKQKANETIASLQHLVLRQTYTEETRKTEEIISDPREALVSALLNRLESLAQESADVDPEIRNSEVVRQLSKCEDGNKNLDSDSEIWEKLETEILKVSPDFNLNLTLLLGNPSVNDYRIAMLIKAGISPTQISIILGRAKGTISSNRQRMCMRIFNKKISNNLFDQLIRTL